jgi:hypothetical protein
LLNQTSEKLVISPHPGSAAEARAAQILRDLGYPLVLQEVGDARGRFDVVAYAAAESGELRPFLAVEIKTKLLLSAHDRVLDQLAAARAKLGTREHLVFDGTSWLAADPGLRHLTPVEAPPAHTTDGPAQLADRDLITSLLWQRLDKGRGSAGVEDAVLELLERLAATRSLDISGTTVTLDERALWESARELTLRLLSSQRGDEWTTEQTVARAIATIAGTGGRLYGDPFCGLGSLLWHVADGLGAAGRSAGLVGVEINAHIAATARAAGSLCPLHIDVQTADSFRDEALAFANPPDRVVTQPPFGLRLPQSYQLSNDEDTPDGDLASVDLCLRMLIPGGRAVLQLSRGWTSRGAASMRYRRYLAEHSHVAALIGLPGTSVRGTSIPSVLLVLEKTQPGQTFVAQLDEDWRAQLAPNGAAMRALLAHLGEPLPDSEGA